MVKVKSSADDSARHAHGLLRVKIEVSFFPLGDGTLGRFEEFDGRKDDWPQYVERLEHFFVANGITTPEKKRAVFLSVVGEATYKMLHNLVSLDKPGDKAYTANWSVR